MKICVIGVGNIGMRYVQGISATHPQAQLFLVDRSSRLEQIGKQGLTNVTLCSSLDDVQDPIDLFVVATSCEPRFSLYKQCLAREPRYIILEKYLFNSRKEFVDCLELPEIPTYVNQWMYGSKTFDCLFETKARSVEVRGTDWGLGCNAVHWMDVMKRHLNISHLDVGPGTRVAEVFPGKRAGYEELYGEFEFLDRDSDRGFKLVDSPDEDLEGRMQIVVDSRVYDFDYTRLTENGKLLSQFPYFSNQIGGIVGGLLNKGKCHLPDLAESVSQHLLIEDILGRLDRRPAIT